MQLNALDRARAIKRPSREAQLMRAPSVQHFWSENRDLFEEAWAEWETKEAQGKGPDASLFDPKLRTAVDATWQDPNSEVAVKDLWEEVFPGVYKAQFLDPERLGAFREYLERVAEADIPLRPPYGISLNRGGAMLDSRSEGYLAAPTFQDFYQDLINRYMRPISRLLFPDIVGYDSQTFGFSIQWQADKDTSLRAHTDASSVTLNVNMNLPGEDFSGSGVKFFDRETKRIEELTFAPGTALIHHGGVPHESMPITEGTRSNMVLWLYGENGQVPRFGTPGIEISASERWQMPEIANDGFAPF